MASTSPSPLPADPANARPIACNPCRQRRSKCSRERPKCERCRDSSIDCVYEEARKILINENYLRELEFKAKAYEDAVGNAPKEGSSPINIKRNSTAGPDNEKEIAEGNAIFEEFGRMGVGDREARSPTNFKTTFKGPAHPDMFLRKMGKISGMMYPDDVSLDLNPRFYEPDLLTPRRLSVIGHIRLPPIDTARRYFAAQYTYIGTIFSFTDPASFDRSLIEAYNGPPPDLADQEACLKYAKILVILAFGQLYSVNQWIDFKGPPGFEYFSHALQLLPDVHEEGSILAVETLSLVGYFFQNMNHRDAAFLYIGMALRMAISLGLHQEVAAPPEGDQLGAISSVSEEEREHRRRVWWSVYSMDRILCVKSGNPITMHDEDIGVAMPSRLEGEPEYCPAVVLRHYTELSRILGEVNKHIYSKGRGRSGEKIMASFKNIMRALAKWHREIPDQLRFDPVKLSISRESVSTLVHYYQCYNMTARPLLFHVVQKRLAGLGGAAVDKNKDWKEGLSQTTINVIGTCISVAQETIKIMRAAAQRDLVATYGYMDSEHIFSASIVLVMVCIAFPPNRQCTDAMNDGLSLLRGMAERGNSYIDARYRLLDHLRSMIAPSPTSSKSAADRVAHPSPFHPTKSISSLDQSSVDDSGVRIPKSSDVGASAPVGPAYPGFAASPDYRRHSHAQHPSLETGTPSVTVPNTGLQQRTLVFGPIPIATGASYPQSSFTESSFGPQFPGSSNSGSISNHPTGGRPRTTSHSGSPGVSQADPASNTPPIYQPQKPTIQPQKNLWEDPASSSYSGSYGSMHPFGSGGSFSLPGLMNLGDVEEMFFDVDMGNAGAATAADVGEMGSDFGLWEAGFADPGAYDLAQLTHAAQMAVDQGGGSMGGGMNMDL